MLRGNKGEWSEVYAFLKLLGDGHLFSGDAELKKIQDLVYPILKIIRTESDGVYEYSYDRNLKIITSEKQDINIPVEQFIKQADILFSKIKSNSKGTFEIPETDKFLEQIKCRTLKAKSSVKTDIKVIIHDSKTNTQPELGFSIKSQLGGASTLLNASKATNFIYQLKHNLPLAQVEDINASRSFIEKFEKIFQKTDIVFLNTEKSVFGNNLVLIDSLLPEITAHLLLQFFSTKLSTIADLTENLRGMNPMGYDLTFHHNFYEYKIKHMLTDIALGLMPASVWTGKYDATGGYLVVREDGDILAYHIYNRNEFEKYLFNNTKLETASTSRHGFGKIYEEKGNQLIKLNLQIRFKK